VDLTNSNLTPLALRRPGRALTIAIVELTLTTAYIHLTLGGLLFTLNAAGYAALAAAMVVVATVPHPLVQRFDWVPRIGLAGYTATTIAGYLVMGPYFSLGWVAKAIEVAILSLLVADLHRAYGSPAGLIRAALDSVGLGPRSRPMGA
jgi:hypothetical protein